MKIGIDMGHTLSGNGTGAVGVVRETDKNREVGNALIPMLTSAGHTVVNCTVDYSSNDLVARTNIANAQTLDLFISLHLNAFDGSAYGVETFIYNGSYNGKETLRTKAQNIQNALVSAIGWYNRGVKEANFHVLRETNSPAILVELGFCDSKRDMDLWNTEAIAKALYQGITGSAYNEVVPTPPPSITTPTTPVNYVVKITADILNVRKGPGTNYPVTTTVKKGEAYTIIEESNNWGKLKSGAGWISLQYTTKITSSTPAPAPTPSVCDREVRRYTERGTCTITTGSGIIFRDKPCTCHGVKQGTYLYNEKVNYDLVVITEKYTWISWIGASTGTRRYMPIVNRQTNERWGSCV